MVGWHTDDVIKYVPSFNKIGKILMKLTFFAPRKEQEKLISLAQIGLKRDIVWYFHRTPRAVFHMKGDRVILRV